MPTRHPHRELNDWLDQHGYRHAHAHVEKTPHPYARKVTSPTGRMEFASKERGHHITTHGRQGLSVDQFALPPGPAERRRGILGRLPIDTIARGRNALTRAAQMKKKGHITAAQLATVKHKVHAAWPSIGER